MARIKTLASTIAEIVFEKNVDSFLISIGLILMALVSFIFIVFLLVKTINIQIRQSKIGIVTNSRLFQ